MNEKYLKSSVKIAAFIAAVSCAAHLHAAPQSSSQTPNGSAAGSKQQPSSAFANSAEAGMLQQAYVILSTGDHDYKGHRVRAMHQIEAAAKLLGMNLSGDGKDKQPQPLSDAKLREAQGLLQNVLGAAEVKNQKRVVKHINEAIDQINIALSIR
jgi:hypothetical protein